jgi:hypothetical protein
MGDRRIPAEITVRGALARRGCLVANVRVHSHSVVAVFKGRGFQTKKHGERVHGEVL